MHCYIKYKYIYFKQKVLKYKYKYSRGLYLLYLSPSTNVLGPMSEWNINNIKINELLYTINSI